LKAADETDKAAPCPFPVFSGLGGASGTAVFIGVQALSLTAASICFTKFSYFFT
jgi:hypothetical protein